ncbi:MAG: PASTA domain-containing protein [Actinomycetota bacterium]|jgi:hypothetical protein|nr:PASTA domain-containing protein [Actinomycetota bacterium]
MESIERPERRPLIPRWVIIASIVIALLVATGFGVLVALELGDTVVVPDLTGMSEGQADVELSRLGLSGVITERRFSSEPLGAVIEQDPVSGAEVPSDTEVFLTLSAGTEEFVMPDIVGNGIVSATAILEGHGLVVKIDVMDSDSPPDIVLESYPSPGTSVRTGETVRLTISGEGSASSVLLPYQMAGLVFVLDPAPVPEGNVDTSLEVSRRLQSLIEASGGAVIVTRSAAESRTAPSVRQTRATVTSATVAIGLDVLAQGAGGMIVTSQRSVVGSDSDAGSLDLTSDLVSALMDVYPSCAAGPETSDPVLASIARPAARIKLGSLSDDADVASFRDPTWADTVARSIYRALGERYGVQ